MTEATESGIPSAYTVADYLAERLLELGVNHLYTVPGDFVTPFLDRVLFNHPPLALVHITGL